MTEPTKPMFQPTASDFSVSLAKMRPSPMINANKIATDPGAGGYTGYQGMDEAFLKKDFAGPDTELGLSEMGIGGGGSGGGFDFGGAVKNFNLGAQGVMGLANAYNAYKQMGLMEDQFNFARADRNQNVANQAAITNDRLEKQANASAQLHGHEYGSQGYNDYMANRTKVSGAAV